MIKTKDVTVGALVQVIDIYSVERPLELAVITAYYGKTPGSYLHTFKMWMLSGSHAMTDRLIHIGMQRYDRDEKSDSFIMTSNNSQQPLLRVSGSGRYMIHAIVSAPENKK